MNASITSSSTKVAADVIAQALRFPPSAPRVLPLLKRHLVDADVDIQQIIDLVRLDPGISARVLQAANSAAFSRGVRCHSVALAVGRIGFDNIFEIVANAVAEQVLDTPLVSYSTDADEFWRRSVVCGLAAEQLAESLGEDTNVAYSIGLLHGVGMVAVDQWVQRNMPTLGFFGRGFPRDYSEGERVLLGFTSADVGTLVLRNWEFPPEMSEPIRWQHTPTTSLAYRNLNCILYAAKWLSSRVCTDAGTPVNPPENRMLAPIKLTVESLACQIPQLQQRLAEIQRTLEDEDPGEAA